MKKLLLKSELGLAALTFSTGGFSALSPYYDSAKQIQTVLASDTLGSQIAGSILKVERVDPLLYRVTTDLCVATVRLNAILPEGAGATQYDVKELTSLWCE